jgi:ubiquinone/menaquinone biosynthesis C-methylase UbiE
MNAVLRWSLRRAGRRSDPRLATLHDELLAGIGGTVVEVGCGRGRLFDRYPPGVRRLVAVEPDADSRRAAAAAASGVLIPVRVVDGDAARLPLPDGAADAVVMAEVLCSVPDPGAALREARRVLRPGGELRVFEHVVAEHPVGRAAQRLVDAAGWPRLLGGCHTARDTCAAIEASGFTWTSLRRVWSASMALASPAGPHLLGIARPSD